MAEICICGHFAHGDQTCLIDVDGYGCECANTVPVTLGATLTDEADSTVVFGCDVVGHPNNHAHRHYWPETTAR